MDLYYNLGSKFLDLVKTFRVYINIFARFGRRAFAGEGANSMVPEVALQERSLNTWR